MLAKRRFYLDLKSRTAQTTKQLVQDLIALGGVSIITISYFLHKFFSILLGESLVLNIHQYEIRVIDKFRLSTHQRIIIPKNRASFYNV